MRLEGTFIVKISILYCIIAAGFSLLGILLAEKGPQPNPLMSLSADEVIGHLVWGLAAGVVTRSLRYIILSGLFAVLIDSDHLVGFAHVDAISRMSHSIAFGVIASIILMLIFGKKNYLLGAIAFGGVLSHISYDIFAGSDGKFPIFAPFYNQQIRFEHEYWIYFEIASIAIIGVVMILTKKDTEKVQIK